MRDGFGIFPVSLHLSLESYDGPSAHVARFRRGAGWLWVGEALISAGGRLDSYDLAVGCMDDSTPIPTFMVPNLLACESSLPLECTEMPPQDLFDLVEAARDPIRTRWLRQSNNELATRYAQFEHDMAAAEHHVDLNNRQDDHAIADLRRRRRQDGVTIGQREILDGVIHQIEDQQLVLQQWLIQRRQELRDGYARAESRLLITQRPRIAFEQSYCVHWRDIAGPSEEARSLIENCVRATQYPGPSSICRPAPVQTSAMRAKAVIESGADSAPAQISNEDRLRAFREFFRQQKDADRQVSETNLAKPALAASPQRDVQPQPSSPAQKHRASDISPTPVSKKNKHAKESERHLILAERTAKSLEALLQNSTRINKVQKKLMAVRNAIEAMIRDGVGGRPAEPTRPTNGAIKLKQPSPIVHSEAATADQTNSLKIRRDALQAELRLHERSGTDVEDGPQRFVVYRSRREGLLKRIAQLNDQIALREQAGKA
jgi:hypothetical protein